MTTTQNNNDTGCIVDEMWGIYVPQRVCAMAIEAGWQGLVPIDDETLQSAYELADEAIEWLNDNMADDGFSYGLWNGGLYYWANDEWQDLY